jgi:hypothetical protein
MVERLDLNPMSIKEYSSISKKTDFRLISLVFVEF